MTDNEWYDLLSKVQKREVLSLQMALNEQGFGKSDDFVMLSCWKEAVRQLRQKYPNPDPSMQNYDADTTPVNDVVKKKVKKKKIEVQKVEQPIVVEVATVEQELVDFS